MFMILGRGQGGTLAFEAEQFFKLSQRGEKYMLPKKQIRRDRLQ